MSRPSWIAPLYGYIVCLVAVITFIISVNNFVNAAFERASPLQSREGRFGFDGTALTSFEAFRSTYALRAPTRTGRDSVADTLSTAELRQRYEALRADRIEQMRFVAMQKLVGSGLLMVLAVGLFFTHWRWVQRQRESPV